MWAIASVASRWKVATRVVALGGAISGPALAHGPPPGPPRAAAIAIEPANGGHLVVKPDAWGLFHKRDAGAHWEYVCAEAYGSRSDTRQHNPVQVLAGGRIVIAASFAGVQLSDDGCTFRAAGLPAGVSAQDVEPGPAGEIFAVTATGSTSGISSLLWKSTDDAETWAVTGAALPDDFVADTVAVAPSDPTRVYVAGRVIGGDTGFLERSSDTGASWERFPLPAGSVGAVPRLTGVHPTRADVLFLRIDGPDDGITEEPDELFVSVDGGRTWSLLLGSTRDLPGFALSPDATTILVAGPADGLWRAQLDDALTKGTAAFHQIVGQSVWGLAWTAELLYAGGDDFLARGVTGYTLGRSTGVDAAVVPVMRLCDVRLAECAATSSVATLCTADWESPTGFGATFVRRPGCRAALATLEGGAPGSGLDAAAPGPPGTTQGPEGGASEHGPEGGASTRGAGPGARAAGAGDDRPRGNSGCGCEIASDGTHDDTALLLAAAMMAATILRSRRAHPRREKRSNACAARA
jgi:photosystem II stability/assembly factor-like uncharacterized protein